MKLSKENQSKTGAFYTPKVWADLAVEYMQRVIPNLEDYFFWDMAAGEGALIEALPVGCRKYATTLEYEDVKILRSKGICANQFNFLSGDLSTLEEIKAIPKHRLIIFTNPPYVTLPANEYICMKKKYKNNDATALFFYRIFKEVQPLMLCSFNKLDLYQSEKHRQLRIDLGMYERLIASFFSPSKSWGLNGNFPILFNILSNFTPA